MISELTDMPTGVVGFEVSGTVRAEDYRDVLLPALERATEGGAIRFVFVIPEFKGITGSAIWEDLKVGFEHLKKWKRIALVTDIQWMTHLTAMFGWMTPGKTKVFTMNERDLALQWVSA